VGPANEQQPEDPRSTYRRLVAELQGRIVGTQNLELIRQLALLGVGHLNGVSGSRLLLVGATGSGKTHAARCLAEAIGAAHMQVDASDLTATGCKEATSRMY
jgi:ATP-dependent protease Clp ATPase subunit